MSQSSPGTSARQSPDVVQARKAVKKAKLSLNRRTDDRAKRLKKVTKDILGDISLDQTADFSSPASFRQPRQHTKKSRQLASTKIQDTSLKVTQCTASLQEITVDENIAVASIVQEEKQCGTCQKEVSVKSFSDHVLLCLRSKFQRPRVKTYQETNSSAGDAKPSSVIICQICQYDLSPMSLSDREAHVNKCIDGGASRNGEGMTVCEELDPNSPTLVNLSKFKAFKDDDLAKEIQRQESIKAEKDKLGELLTCHICQKDLAALTSHWRTQHVNSCIDKVEADETRKKEEAEALERARNKVLDCPLCGKLLKTQSSRKSHLKKCAATLSVSASVLMKRVKDQEEQYRMQLEAGVLPETKRPPVRRRQPRNNQPGGANSRSRNARAVEEVPNSKFDEDTQLAIALSTSIQGQDAPMTSRLSSLLAGDNVDQSNKVDAFSILMSPKPKQKPVKKGRKTKKERLESMVTTLMVRTEEEQQQRLAAKIEAMLLSHGGSGSHGNTPAFKRSAVTAKYSLQGQDMENSSLWRLHSVTDQGVTLDSNHGSRGRLFYVSELGHAIVPDQVVVGSKLRKMTAIPGWKEDEVVKKMETPAPSGIKLHSANDTTMMASTQTAVMLAELANETMHNRTLANCTASDTTPDGLNQTLGPHEASQCSSSTSSSSQALRLDQNTSQQYGQTSDRRVSGRHPDDKAASTKVLEETGFIQLPVDEKSQQTALMTLSSQLAGMVDSPEMSDLKVITKNGKIHAHKFVLAFRAPRMLEIVTSDDDILLREFPTEPVIEYLQYVYAASLEFSHRAVFDVKKLAERFGHTEVVTHCSGEIENHHLESSGDEGGAQTVDTELQDLLRQAWGSDNESSLADDTSESPLVDDNNQSPLADDDSEDLNPFVPQSERNSDESEETEKVSLTPVQIKNDSISGVREVNKTVRFGVHSESNNSVIECRHLVDNALSQALLNKLEASFAQAPYDDSDESSSSEFSNNSKVMENLPSDCKPEHCTTEKREANSGNEWEPGGITESGSVQEYQNDSKIIGLDERRRESETKDSVMCSDPNIDDIIRDLPEDLDDSMMDCDINLTKCESDTPDKRVTVVNDQEDLSDSPDKAMSGVNAQEELFDEEDLPLTQCLSYMDAVEKEEKGETEKENVSPSCRLLVQNPTAIHPRILSSESTFDTPDGRRLALVEDITPDLFASSQKSSERQTTRSFSTADGSIFISPEQSPSKDEDSASVKDIKTFVSENDSGDLEGNSPIFNRSQQRSKDPSPASVKVNLAEVFKEDSFSQLKSKRKRESFHVLPSTWLSDASQSLDMGSPQQKNKKLRQTSSAMSSPVFSSKPKCLNRKGKPKNVVDLTSDEELDKKWNLDHSPGSQNSNELLSDDLNDSAISTQDKMDTALFDESLSFICSTPGEQDIGSEDSENDILIVPDQLDGTIDEGKDVFVSQEQKQVDQGKSDEGLFVLRQGQRQGIQGKEEGYSVVSQGQEEDILGKEEGYCVVSQGQEEDILGKEVSCALSLMSNNLIVTETEKDCQNEGNGAGLDLTTRLPEDRLGVKGHLGPENHTNPLSTLGNSTKLKGTKPGNSDQTEQAVNMLDLTQSSTEEEHSEDEDKDKHVKNARESEVNKTCESEDKNNMLDLTLSSPEPVVSDNDHHSEDEIQLTSPDSQSQGENDHVDLTQDSPGTTDNDSQQFGLADDNVLGSQEHPVAVEDSSPEPADDSVIGQINSLSFDRVNKSVIAHGSTQVLDSGHPSQGAPQTSEAREIMNSPCRELNVSGLGSSPLQPVLPDDDVWEGFDDDGGLCMDYQGMVSLAGTPARGLTPPGLLATPTSTMTIQTGLITTPTGALTTSGEPVTTPTRVWSASPPVETETQDPAQLPAAPQAGIQPGKPKKFVFKKTKNTVRDQLPKGSLAKLPSPVPSDTDVSAKPSDLMIPPSLSTEGFKTPKSPRADVKTPVTLRSRLFGMKESAVHSPDTTGDVHQEEGERAHDQDVTFDPPTDVDTDVSMVMEAANDGIQLNDEKTPVKEKSKKRRKIKPTESDPGTKKTMPWVPPSPYTPMPAYENMVTPMLKKAVQRFGIKALPKKRMITVLKHLYEETHGYETDPECDLSTVTRPVPNGTTSQPDPKPGQSGQAVAKGKKGKSCQATSGTAATKGTSKKGVSKTKTVMAKKTSLDVSQASDEDTDEDSSSPDLPEESILELSPSKPGSRMDAEAKKKRVWEYIQSKEDMQLSILMYQPLEFGEFQREIKEMGVNIGASLLMEFLDDYSIPFTMRNVDKTKENPGRTRKKRKPKETGDTVAGSQTKRGRPPKTKPV